MYQADTSNGLYGFITRIFPSGFAYSAPSGPKSKRHFIRFASKRRIGREGLMSFSFISRQVYTFKGFRKSKYLPEQVECISALSLAPNSGLPSIRFIPHCELKASITRYLFAFRAIATYFRKPLVYYSTHMLYTLKRHVDYEILRVFQPYKFYNSYKIFMVGSQGTRCCYSILG